MKINKQIFHNLPGYNANEVSIISFFVEDIMTELQIFWSKSLSRH